MRILKKFRSISFLLLTFSVIIQGSAVQAANDTDTHMNYQSGNSSTIKPLDPLLPDPTKPVVPLDPTDPTGPPTGTGGSLSLDFASGFQFGNQAISTKDETYYAYTQEYIDFNGVKKKGPNYVQITDVRGTGTGWKLTVKQKDQFQTNQSQELVGAELVFNNGEMVSNLSNAYAPTAETTIVLPIGTEIDVAAAANEKGIGTWLYRFGSDEQSGEKSIQLTVPGSTVKYAKKYQTSLTWNLKNVP